MLSLQLPAFGNLALVAALLSGFWNAPFPVRPSNAPDLDVQFIELTPAYPYDGQQKYPHPGEAVAWVAHIANRGTAASGAFTYTWAINEAVQVRSTHPGLLPGATAILTFPGVWQEEEFALTVSLDPQNSIPEVTETNNSLVNSNRALALGIWVEQSVYDFFNAHVNRAGWGGNSFDDWIQRHAGIWNTMLSEAGALDRIRVSKIVVVPNGALNCNGNQPVEDKTVDLMWGFTSESVGVTSPAKCSQYAPRYRDEPATWDHDPGVIHELNHARYHIDLYGLNMEVHSRPLAEPLNATDSTLRLVDPPDFAEFTPPLYFALDGELIYCTGRSEDRFTQCTRGAEGTRSRAHNRQTPAYIATIRAQDGLGNALIGSAALPHMEGSTMVYQEPYFYTDIMDGGYGYGEYSAWVWNRIARQRPRCGNANAPCNLGEFLNEIPSQNILALHRPNGEPVANAVVEIYWARPYPSWYGRQYLSTPDRILATDPEGRVDLGPTPFGENKNIEHGFGFSNALVMLKITAGGTVYVRFLDITAFNLAYWKKIPTPTYALTLDQGLALGIDAPRVSVMAAPPRGNAGLNLAFKASNAGGRIHRYLWNFGDGITSTETAPIHRYTQPGTYTVTLQVQGPGGSDRWTNTVKVRPPSQARTPLAARSNAGGTEGAGRTTSP